MTIQTGGRRMPKSHFSAGDEPLQMDKVLPHSIVGGNDSSSSLLLSSSLSNRAVDQVWGDLQHPNNNNSNNSTDDHDHGDQMRSPDDERNPSLGEMTLENFLVKAGVVTENTTDKKGILPIFGVVDPNVAPQFQHHQNQWLQFQNQHQQQFHQTQQNAMGVYLPSQNFTHPLSLGTASVMDVAFGEGQIAALQDTSSSVRKRAPTTTHDEIVEKSAERRHKRMIKNRESAARSRARKQAYTNELEIKISHLEEENERLRKRKEIEDALLSVPMPDQKYQLRRTSSSPL